MKTIKKLSVALGLILMPVLAMAQTVTVDGIKYSIIGNNTVEVAKQERLSSNKIVIPPSVTIDSKTYIVGAIGEQAFYESDIQKISLPTTIKIIRNRAFAESKLTQIKLPVGLEKIEDDGFRKCKSLRYVYFPPSLEVLL